MSRSPVDDDCSTSVDDGMGAVIGPGTGGTFIKNGVPSESGAPPPFESTVLTDSIVSDVSSSEIEKEWNGKMSFW